jgi:hypothetical protein
MAWVQHIKDFAKEKGITYGCALSDPECSRTYREKAPVVLKPIIKKDEAMQLALKEMDKWTEETYNDFYNEKGELRISKKKTDKIIKKIEGEIGKEFGLPKNWLKK